MVKLDLNPTKDSNFIHCNIELSLNRANPKFCILKYFFVGFEYYFVFLELKCKFVWQRRLDLKIKN